MTRRTYSIPGGIHPAENKHQSMQVPLSKASIPDTLTFPISQHIGAPAKILVEEGDRVLKGQCIAAAAGFVSAPIHASTSGTVIEIGKRVIPNPSGLPDTCIVIKADNKDEWIDLDPIDDYTQIERSVLIDKIRSSGIVGMGGAGFPTSIKLNPHPDSTIRTLIINGTECEPYITADDTLMQTDPETVIKGALLLGYLLKDPENILIGVEDNKPEGIAALRAAARGTKIEVVSFPTKYPSGGEKQLIQILTGKEVPSGGIPADMGVVLQNMGTTVACYNAITKGEPLISRITTVTGNAVSQPRNYEVLLGTPYSHLLNLSGFQADKANRIICGGPMMGFTVDSIETPIVKATNCILVPTPEEIPEDVTAQACIRCGSCAEACPVNLLPQQLFWYSQSKEYDKLNTHHLMDCIECGCCSFVCPSNIPLVQYYRASKADIRVRAQDQVKADKARQRFEAKQARQEREEAEKAAKKAARKAAATAAKTQKPAAATEDDPVKAAIARVAAQKVIAEKSPEEQLAKLEKLQTSAHNKVAKAEQKLSEIDASESDQIDKLKSTLENAKLKLADANKKVEDFTKKKPLKAALETSADPAQVAIDRAKAKAAEAALLSPLEKQEQQVKSLKERIAKAQSKLAKARAEGSEHVEILDSSLKKMTEKLASAIEVLETL